MAHLLKRLFRPAEQRSGTLSSPSAELLNIFAALSSGPDGKIVVSPVTALQSPTVAAAVKAISETAGMLPIAVRRRVGDGWEKVTDHPASAVLNGFANPWTPSETLRTQLTVDALLNVAGGFAYVVRVNGAPRELQRVSPSVVTVEFDQSTGEPRYLVSLAGGGQETVHWRNMIHVQAPGSTPERSMCPAHLARGAIAIDLLLTAHQREVFEEGGGLPRMFVSPENADITPTALTNALTFVAAQIRKNPGQPVILPAAFKEAVKSFALGDQQFLELRRLSIEDIAREFRTPLSIVGDLTRGTYSNTEQGGRQFLQLCLLPWLEVWEGALTRCLIDEQERKDVELEFIVEDLQRADLAARATAYRNSTGGAWMTPNETRALEGYAPVAGGEGLIKQAGQTDAGNVPKDNSPNA